MVNLRNVLAGGLVLGVSVSWAAGCGDFGAGTGIECAAGEVDDASPSDCVERVCVNGGFVEQPDDAEVPEDDGNPCTDEVCKGGTAHPSSAAGAPCASTDNPTGVGKCDGAELCLGCTMPFECPAGYTCGSDNTCASCMNGQKDGAETDIDCGNGCIKSCVTGQMCNQTSDCAGECDTGLCVDCFDGAKNGTESDVDCGGSCAQKCSAGSMCKVAQDCLAVLNCTNNICN